LCGIRDTNYVIFQCVDGFSVCIYRSVEVFILVSAIIDETIHTSGCITFLADVSRHCFVFIIPIDEADHIILSIVELYNLITVEGNVEVRGPCEVLLFDVYGFQSELETFITQLTNIQCSTGVTGACRNVCAQQQVFGGFDVVVHRHVDASVKEA